MTEMRESVVPTVAKGSGDSGYGVWTFRGMSAVLLFGLVVWYNSSVEGGGDKPVADDVDL